MPMDSKIVNKSIREKIKPLLEEQGFSKFTPRSAWRYRNNRINVINFQSFNSYLAESIGCTTFSFSVNLGCFLLYVPRRVKNMKDNGGELVPKEYECQFRSRLQRTFEQKELNRKDIWYIGHKGEYVNDSIEDVSKQIQQIAIPWFERLESDREILRILKGNSEDMKTLWGFGANPSPIRSLLTGYVALEVNEKELAKKKLMEAIKSGCFNNITNDINKLLLKV